MKNICPRQYGCRRTYPLHPLIIENDKPLKSLYPYGRRNDIRWLVEPLYLLIHLIGHSFQCFSRSLLKTGRTALYRQRTAEDGQVYLAKLIAISPALLFEIYLRPRYILVVAVQLDEVVPYRLNNLLCYPAMRHMKFYVHKFYICKCPYITTSQRAICCCIRRESCYGFVKR